ncbi:MAG: hypothetical protein R3345_01390, partial [Fulvivirga sp.]|nr:hypothetical protein [Fulvivirga sp.]
MFDDYTICPYPGLRSFNEDESIYFKGRDTHVDEVVELLQRNKFLMVTGASGDGKSSLIFGGLVPNAKAGFFKAKYNNWKIVHFRPERSPLSNLAQGLGNAFEMENSDIIETEISRGFSSLVDFYTASKYYEQTEEGKEKAEGSNLMIIVDQFEEFFTNPENFFKGAPTQEAQIAVNVLLETARIALSKELPIYVVFTMRSDFIGQCSSFRGLPEYIGFSQFFVPRLKRRDLQQVIEEPANLNGNKITRRLTERLIYDLEEGIDQLPILQHALNQIWHAADSGKEEMDLIHYAMVGGMPVDELPDEDIDRFNQWFIKLPEGKRALYKESSLQKIIDIHADLLYLTAWEYYNKSNPEYQLSAEEAQRVIAMTFACLTKIDESRAVRNRMTLREITNIINEENITEEVVAGVLNYFREPGNTFIHPFIEDNEPETQVITSDTVLDITHEALIRNWQRLKKWAWKEFEYYEKFVDLQKQIDKWLAHNKSRNFLLPIGPLLYFERWFEECKPNTWWINRYNDESPEPDENLESSRKLLRHIRQFLKQSSRNVIVTKTVTKYGPRRIITGLTVVAMILLSSFYFFDAEKKQNQRVLDEIFDKGSEMITDREVGGFDKAIFMLASELNEPASIMKSLELYDDAESRIRAANTAYTGLNAVDPRLNAPVKQDLINQIFSDLKIMTQDTSRVKETLEYYANFLSMLAYDHHFNKTEYISNVRQEVKEDLYQFIVRLLKNKSDLDAGIWFHRCIDHLLLLKLSNQQIDGLISMLSPWEDDDGRFRKYFPYGVGMLMGRNGSISHNGGYHLLSSLYAARGNLGKTLQCLDSLVQYNTNYFHPRSYSGEYNIMEYLARYDHRSLIDPYVTAISEIRDIPNYEVFKQFTVKAGKVHDSYYDFHVFYPGYVSINTYLIDFEDYKYFFDLYEKSILKELEPGDEAHFELSLAFKKKAIFLHYNASQKGLAFEESTFYDYLDSAFNYFEKVSQPYLRGKEFFIYRYYTDGVRRANLRRDLIFKYPDHIGYNWLSRRYHSSLFLEYVMKNNLFHTIYQSPEALSLINDWLANYLEIPANIDQRNDIPLKTEVLKNLRKHLVEHAKAASFDMNLIELLIANDEFEEGNIENALQHADAINLKTLPITTTSWEYLNLTAILNETWQLAYHL